LIHDNDKKFTDAHDTVFRSECIRVIPTPFQAPNANAFAERWVRTVREECLNYLLIFNGNHLRRVLTTFIEYYNTARPHQGLEQQSPISPAHSRSPLAPFSGEWSWASSVTTTVAQIKLPSVWFE
jgi:putative transposase